VAEKIATLRGLPFQQVCNQTAHNVSELFWQIGITLEEPDIVATHSM
jgi:hypothetical protein